MFNQNLPEDQKETIRKLLITNYKNLETNVKIGSIAIYLGEYLKLGKKFSDFNYEEMCIAVKEELGVEVLPDNYILKSYFETLFHCSSMIFLQYNFVNELRTSPITAFWFHLINKRGLSI